MHGHSVHAKDEKSIQKVTHGHTHKRNVYARDKTNALKSDHGHNTTSSRVFLIPLEFRDGSPFFSPYVRKTRSLQVRDIRT